MQATASIYGRWIGRGTFSCLHSPLAPSERADVYPQTTYLQRWMQTSLARQYYAPKKLVALGDHGIPCCVCGGMRDATTAVLGGDTVRTRSGDRVRLNGMAQIVTHCCDVCLQAALGPDCVPDAAPRSWTVMPLPRPSGSAK